MARMGQLRGRSRWPHTSRGVVLGIAICVGSYQVTSEMRERVNAMARHVWTCSLFLLISSITLVAQTHTVSLSGTITDPSAKPVPNASVSLKNLGTEKA